MKKSVAILLAVLLMMPQLTVFALHDAVKAGNESYSGFIAEAIEKSKHTGELDTDKAYVIEKGNTNIFENGGEADHLYVAIPLLDTDDIVYTRFYQGTYKSEAINAASMLHTETCFNTKIDTYIAENGLKNVKEIVSMILLVSTRADIYAYRVIAEGETYYIPYRVEGEYNLAKDEDCALESGKAYRSENFSERLSKEKESYTDYKEAQKKADEARKEAEAEKEAAQYRPVISLDKDGDEVVKINGINLDDVLDELEDHIEEMGFGSKIELGVKTGNDTFMEEYYWQKGCDVDAVEDFAEDLFDEITTQVTTGKPSEERKASYCQFSLKHDEGFTSVKHNVEVSIWEDGVRITVDKDEVIECKVKNADAIIRVMQNYAERGFRGFENESNDENTPSVRGNLDGLTKTDVITFKFKLTEDVAGSLTKEVASVGKTVSGVFEKYKENKYKSTYILTLSGDIGTASWYRQNQSSLSGIDEYFSNNIPLTFLDKFRFEDDRLVEYKLGKANETYKFKMIFKNGDIAKVTFEGIDCTGLTYKQLTEDAKLSEQYTEKDKEKIIKKEKMKAAEECADTLFAFGLFKGTDKGYELEKGLTREEGVTVLVRLLGEEEKAKKKDFGAVFRDVAKDRWSYAAVMYCYNHNITKGTGKDTFSPSARIDAKQFVALLLRLLGYDEVNPETALAASVDFGLLSTEMAEALEEKELFTRSEMVQIVYSSLQAQMKDKTMFAKHLLEKGVIKEELAQLIED